MAKWNPFKKKEASPAQKEQNSAPAKEQSAASKTSDFGQMRPALKNATSIEDLLPDDNPLALLYKETGGVKEELHAADFLPYFAQDKIRAKNAKLVESDEEENKILIDDEEEDIFKLPFCWDRAQDAADKHLTSINNAKNAAALEREEAMMAINDGKTPVKLPEDIVPMPINASVSVFVSQDNLEAWCIVYPPAHGGLDITAEDLRSALEDNKVVFGIDEDRVAEIGDRKGYLQLVKIAEGVPQIDGIDGHIIEIVHVPSSKSLTEDKRGRVDFKQLNWIATVHAGDKICEIVPPSESQDGTDVKGTLLKARTAKGMQRVNGKNTELSEDGRYLLASIDGQLTRPGATFVVTDILTIQGDVDYSTGNIKVSGSVLIKGNVNPTFTVEAKYDIIVEGLVDDATLIAGGSISALNGIVLSDHGSVTSKGDLHCKFIEYGKAYVGGDAYFETVVLSDINCEGNVYVTSGRSLIMGGNMTAMGNIEVGALGNKAQCPTTVRLAVTNKVHEERVKLEEELKEAQNELQMIENNIAKIKAATENAPSEEAAKTLAKLDSALTLSKMKTERFKQRIDQIDLLAQKAEKGRISVDHAYPQVTIQIGSIIDKLRIDIDYSTFRLKDGAIEYGPR